jgi:hypothetical protein
MSLFSSSFDLFDRYAAAVMPASGGPFREASGHPDLVSAMDADSLQPEAVARPIDPFDWVLGLDGTSWQPGAAASAEQLRGGREVADGSTPLESHAAGESSADGWLAGHEWSGSLSSGTMDSSGQGNDVFSVDGEVLSLPT